MRLRKYAKKPKGHSGATMHVVGGTRKPAWGKNINKKAERLAGPVKVGRLEDLPEDHPARQG